jgi:hypothetical protein
VLSFEKYGGIGISTRIEMAIPPNCDAADGIIESTIVCVARPLNAQIGLYQLTLPPTKAVLTPATHTVTCWVRREETSVNYVIDVAARRLLPTRYFHDGCMVAL